MLFLIESLPVEPIRKSVLVVIVCAGVESRRLTPTPRMTSRSLCPLAICAHQSLLIPSTTRMPQLSARLMRPQDRPRPFLSLRLTPVNPPHQTCGDIGGNQGEGEGSHCVHHSLNTHAITERATRTADMTATPCQNGWGGGSDSNMSRS